jgi:methyl-accepting chemotaxis protein
MRASSGWLLALPVLLSACGTVGDSPAAHDLGKVLGAGSGFVGNVSRTVGDTVELTKQGIDTTKKTIDTIKTRADEVQQGVQKIQEGVKQIRGEGARK